MRDHVLLYDPEDPQSFEPNAVHKRRTDHLKETYGLGLLFVHPPHEMPEDTLTPNFQHPRTVTFIAASRASGPHYRTPLNGI